MKTRFKICDPIHGFIRFDEIEKQVIDSIAFQRLRYIHQMGVAYLVYPGATHTRFEHSLGVMELASRIFDCLVDENNRVLAFDLNQEDINYWRKIIRLAALCHDLGHLPFSHTAEKSLLPRGGHEEMTERIIQSPELRRIWMQVGDSTEQDIIRLSTGHSELSSNRWHRVFSQVITDDNFGADRMDYLLRDAYYTGVSYGRFDYHQLIDTLRILPSSSDEALILGITASGIGSVESLWIARYLMYVRVYHHVKARSYSNHMHRFMTTFYQKVGFPQSVSAYLEQTDFLILTAILAAAKDGQKDAQCLLKRRDPFLELRVDEFPESKLLALRDSFERDFDGDIYFDYLPPKPGERAFPVLTDEDTIVLSTQISQFLREIPLGGQALRLYAALDKAEQAKNWLFKAISNH